jgi:hypothetical protein
MQKTNTADSPITIGIAIAIGLGLGLGLGIAIEIFIAIAQSCFFEAQLKLQYSRCNPLQIVNRYLPIARVTEQDG